MKVFNLSIMLTVRLNYLLLLLVLSVFALVCSYPSITLNEKNKEVSWEAWLLVDDQNQNRQQHQVQDGQVIPIRRITAKSVFVAPTFSPENLPPCAEGYNSDPLGRCVKIIKLDEDKHLDFLVSKLNEKFGSSIDYETTLEIDESNSQPTKLDIPFIPDYEDYYSNDTPQEELDMAIIVTPTTRETEEKKTKDDDDDSSKVQGKRDDNVYEQELKRLAKTTTIKYDDDDDDDVGETELTTTITTESSTVTEFDGTTTTTTNTMETTTTVNDELIETTLPTEIPTTTAPKITTYHPIATTYHPYFDWEILGASRTRNLVKFPDEVGAVARSHPDGNFVRFPDVDYKHQQEGLAHRTRDVDEHNGNYFNEIVTPQPSQRVHEMVLPPFGHNYKFLPSKADPVRYQTATTDRHHLMKKPFVLPPIWSVEDHHKPIVLRFSRKHFNVDTNKFKNSEFYRSLPMDDLTYLFGYKNGQTSHR